MNKVLLPRFTALFCIQHNPFFIFTFFRSLNVFCTVKVKNEDADAMKYLYCYFRNNVYHKALFICKKNKHAQYWIIALIVVTLMPFLTSESKSYLTFILIESVHPSSFQMSQMRTGGTWLGPADYSRSWNGLRQRSLNRRSQMLQLLQEVVADDLEAIGPEVLWLTPNSSLCPQPKAG